jgi:hypothetical protein
LQNDVFFALAFHRNVRISEIAGRLDLLEIAGQNGLQNDLMKCVKT